MQVRLSSLADVQMAIISRLKCEQLTVSRRATCAQSIVDPRVCVTFDQKSFPTKKPISITAQVYRPIGTQVYRPDRYEFIEVVRSVKVK